MFKKIVAVFAGSLFVAACAESADVNTTDAAKAGPANVPSSMPAPAPGQRGGSIRVGEQTWTIVPSIQCRVFPGGIVSIAGHAESDPKLEIVIDVDPHGPTGVRIGADGGSVSWNTVRETLKIEVKGKQVKGTATFSVYSGGAGERAEGEFRVDC